MLSYSALLVFGCVFLCVRAHLRAMRGVLKRRAGATCACTRNLACAQILQIISKFVYCANLLQHLFLTYNHNNLTLTKVLRLISVARVLKSPMFCDVNCTLWFVHFEPFQFVYKFLDLGSFVLWLRIHNHNMMMMMMMIFTEFFWPHFL